MNKFFWGFMVAIMLAAIAIYVGMKSDAEKNFAQSIAAAQSRVSEAQAEAIGAQARAIELQAEINQAVVIANLQKAQAETFLIYTGIAAITILVSVLVALAIVAIRINRVKPVEVEEVEDEQRS
jgi:Flp pilus assembly protein TadB